MSTLTYTRFVERESTHAVYRKNVQLRLLPAPDPAHQAALVTMAITLARIARSFDKAFDYQVRAESPEEIVVEFELNFPDRFASAVNEWIVEEAKIRPEIRDLLIPSEAPQAR